MKNLLAVLLSIIITLFPFLGFNNNNNPTAPQVNVTEEAAKAIILEHAGLEASEITRYRIELERERTIYIYEIEFDSGKYEYDYEVNAETGKIIKAEKEFKD
ncbi:MAG: hypothetical protein E7536_06485 [Ruminococcaceae bacterium]|nr:hypothetical protein [Oscillospiraceae bacterium]